MASVPRLRLGTRGSALALAQTREARARLAAAHPELAPEAAVEIVVIRTTGDRVQDRNLTEIGGKGLFTKEIEEALFDRGIDAAVHSMKDLPTWLPEGLEIAAILPREDPRDALFLRVPRAAAEAGPGLAALPPGAVVGTSSLRRRAQVLLARPDLTVVPLRGNVETRLRKLAEGQADATLLAVAGVKRLGLGETISAVLEPEEMLPAVAQGAIGIEIRADDAPTRAYVSALNDRDSGRRLSAERACLAVLEGSCRTPIGALAELDRGGAILRLRALISLPDGSQVHRAEESGPAAAAAGIGHAVGTTLRAAAGPAFFAALAGA